MVALLLKYDNLYPRINNVTDASFQPGNRETLHGKYAESIRLYNTEVIKYPGDDSLRTELGMAYFYRGSAYAKINQHKDLDSSSNLTILKSQEKWIK